MGKTDKRTDLYISKAAPFAQPILRHFRKLVHEVCPECTEVIKWSFPNFEYKGLLCAMASFKEHCAIGFRKAALMKDRAKLIAGREDHAMGHFGRITSLADLPSEKVLKAYIAEAVQLNEEDIKLPVKKKAPGKATGLKAPAYMVKAINSNKKASVHFSKFSVSQKNEYVQWITEAKTEETRMRRLDTAVVWISEGKIRNWKYVKK